MSSTAPPTDPADAGPRTGPWWPYALLLVAAGAAAYAGSFGGAFVLDDLTNIVQNPEVRSLGLPATGDPNTRPLVTLSLQANYALARAATGDGLAPAGYHAFNLLVHVAAALALFGLLRRSLRRSPPGWLSGYATPLAAAVALLWVVHPLNTQSVTYIIQRAEAMASLGLLLVLYLAARDEAAAEQGRARWPWLVGVVAAGWAACLSKQVAVVAPLMLLLYDRAFLAGSWGGAFARRGVAYALLALGSLWLVAGVFTVDGPPQAISAGFDLQKHTWWEYAWTQPKAVLHYARLVIVPYPLVFDYGWRAFTSVGQALPWLVAVGGLLILTLVTLWRWPRAGTVAALFFVILAPSSSVLPIADVAVEHRAYLASAAVVTLVVLAAAWGLRHALGGGWHAAGAVLTLMAAAALAWITFERNQDYRDPQTLWLDTATKAPENPRAQHNLANVYAGQDRLSEAIDRYWRTLEIEPGHAQARVNLGITLLEAGRIGQARAQFLETLKHWPDYPDALVHLGEIADRANRLAEAAQWYARAIEAGEDTTPLFNSLGIVYARQGRLAEAAAAFEQAVRRDPSDEDARANLAQARAMLAAPESEPRR